MNKHSEPKINYSQISWGIILIIIGFLVSFLRLFDGISYFTSLSFFILAIGLLAAEIMRFFNMKKKNKYHKVYKHHGPFTWGIILIAIGYLFPYLSPYLFPGGNLASLIFALFVGASFYFVAISLLVVGIMRFIKELYTNIKSKKYANKP